MARWQKSAEKDGKGVNPGAGSESEDGDVCGGRLQLERPLKDDNYQFDQFSPFGIFQDIARGGVSSKSLQATSDKFIRFGLV